MKRRPKPFVVKKNLNDLPQNWDPMKSDERYLQVPLSPGSVEYNKVYSVVQSANKGSFSVHRIERIQNPFHYHAFQNKVKDMKKIHKTDAAINIQQLFHGTKFENIDSICSQNFDWRLHGSSVGQAFGRGTYFSPLSSVAHVYCSGSNKTLFIARVIVGTITFGNSSLVRPPTNPFTKMLYDSTVDNIPNPSIIVKYDTQEYYPEYVLSVT